MKDARVSHSSKSLDPFWVDGWRVDASSLRISRDGRETRLEPRAMAVLVYLAGRPGETVTREELEREIWAGQVVVYEALSNTIAKLRKAFDDDSSNPRVIETIPKIGYRMIAEVTRSVTAAASNSSTSTRSRIFLGPIHRW